MKYIDIQIEDTQLAELGIEQPAVYATLRFNEAHLVGYWTNSNGDTITFYLGPQSFICENNAENRDVLISALLWKRDL